MLRPDDADATLASWDAELAFRPVFEATADKAGTGWVIGGPRGAAALLGLQPSTLRSRMRKLGLARPRAGAGAP